MSTQSSLSYRSDEKWKDIPGYEGIYQVSDHGQVKRIKDFKRYKAGSLLRPDTNNTGHMSVQLHGVGDGRRKLYIHRLVMMAFVGEPNGKIVNHKNGDPTNNHLENLEYCTHSQNTQHSLEKLRRNVGVDRGHVKLSDDEVREIRRIYHIDGVSQRKLAIQFKVSPSTIQGIVELKTWRHVTE